MIRRFWRAHVSSVRDGGDQARTLSGTLPDMPCQGRRRNMAPGGRGIRAAVDSGVPHPSAPDVHARLRIGFNLRFTCRFSRARMVVAWIGVVTRTIATFSHAACVEREEDMSIATALVMLRGLATALLSHRTA